MQKIVKIHHHNILDIVAETDDELMLKYLEGQEMSIEEIKKGIRKATIKCKITPVLCGSAYKNKGIQPLLDAVVDFLPSPIDIPPAKGINVKNDEEVE